MCRNIKNLYNFEPPVTEQEIADAALQFVRKVSGTTKPSKLNETAFDLAVIEISESVSKLLSTLITTSPPKDREVEAAKAKKRSAERFKKASSPNVA